MIKRISGKPKVEWFPKTASTAFINGGLTSMITGLLIPADATSGQHFGVILRDVLSTDDDYADENKVPVDFCAAEDVFEADVPNGDLALADIGITCDLMADGAGIDPDATSKNVVTIVGYVSASKALIKVNAMAAHKDVATT